MVWAQIIDNEGKVTGHVPLDPKAVTYLVTNSGTDGPYHALRAENTLVSHFATCPNASQFSGRKK